MRRMILTLLIVFLFPIVSLAGWEHDETGVRYKNDDGTYKIGWYQDTDGKWYYMDDNTGYMLKNTTTPDGYTVNESGAWFGDKKDNQNMKQYDNVSEFEVTAYKNYDLQQTLEQFGSALPVLVNYNDRYEYSYKNKRTLSIEISRLEVSNEGVLCVTYSADEENFYHVMNVLTRYMFADGTYKDVVRDIGTWGGKIEIAPVMDYYGSKGAPKPISAEVYIDVADVE